MFYLPAGIKECKKKKVKAEVVRLPADGPVILSGKSGRDQLEECVCCFG